MKVEAININEMEMEAWTISPSNSLDLRRLHSIEPQKVWSTMLILMIPFSDPPIVSLSFDNSLSFDVEVFTIIDLE